MAVDANGDRYRAPALDKGLDILELLASTEESLSQAEIAKALKRSPNEIYRMLDRLVRRSYVTRTKEDRYEITLKLFAMAHQRPPIRRLVSQAIPVLRRIARRADQAAQVVMQDRGNLVVVAQADPPGIWSVSIRVGASVGLVNTGSGHIFLALSSPEECRMMMEEHEPVAGEVVPDDLEAQLGAVRERGYVFSESAQVEGVVNLSVPIRGPNGAVIAALTCPFIRRLDVEHAMTPEEVIALLLESSAEISSPTDDVSNRED